MIVPMKKLALLTLESDRHGALNALARLGAVHVAHVKEPTGEHLEHLRSLRRLIKLALGAVPEHGGAGRDDLEPARVVREVFERMREIKRQNEALDGLAVAYRRLAPFGDFDPQVVSGLAEKGVFVTLHRLGAKEILDTSEDVAVKELGRGKDGSFWAVISLGQAFDGPGRVEPGKRSLADIGAEMDKRAGDISRLQGEIRDFSGDRPRVQELLAGIEKKIEFAEVESGMGSVDLEKRPLAFLEGYIPAEKVGDLKAEAKAGGWGLVLDDPGEEDNPPTLLRNPRWVRPIRAVFDAVGVLPGYEEADVSGAVLLFLSLFFAMIVGDAGYGLLFMALSALGKAKFKKIPESTYALLYVMSGCTVVWGALTGNWFGVSGLPAPLESLKLDWLTGDDASGNLMGLTFLIGAVHLTLAHIWVMLRLAPDLRFLAQIGWICTTWVMYFAAMSLVLMQPFPAWAVWALVIGLALIVVFTVPPNKVKTQWTEFVMMPLSLISNFVDVVSYVRLFAVGAATFAVANAFNQMAVDLGAGGVIASLGAALVLFFGHTLNILLAAMGVLVHGVRLNTLEFAGHMGLKWSGYRYAPFRTRSGTTDFDES
jgi:V/A-type H+-transporting ATPase subunit I